MSQLPIIELEQVGVQYRLAKQRIPSFKEYAVHWLRGALVYEEFWGIKDLSFSIQRGESVGVIGHNGAGKSTLLKVISRVLPPSTGRVAIRGSVTPLLELGTGFDPELTGVENIYLNALLFGRARAEVDRAIGDVVETSGLGEFIHAPIRQYSSGMWARLGFAVATAWTPEILILDEVLAVGDAAFQQRCHERMRQFHEEGSTILLVSHDPSSIVKTCERCLWLERGRLRADGPTATVLRAYQEASTRTADAPMASR